MAKTQTTRSTAPGAKFAFVALVALSLLFVQAVNSEAHASPDKKRPNYGRVKLSTNPGGFPVLIDGQPAGSTTASERLIDLPPGPHTIEILFPQERWTREFVVSAGRIYCIGLAYAPRTIPLPAALPCPYPVNVTAPSQVTDGEVITFASNVSYSGSSALNYTWTISPAGARIISGAGTPSIMVDSTGVGNQPVTAILVVDDGSGERACRQTAQAVTNVTAIPITPPKSRIYDQFEPPAMDDIKARLDNLAIELQNAPTAQGYIIVYAGRRNRAGTADRLIERSRQYLVTERGIDSSRLVFQNGGYRETDYFELWLVPQGAETPQATPTVQPGEARPAPSAPRRRRTRRE
ncbi:MAG TPA: hypothetical protein VD861_11970 [Pyrinomonadaceae bacterium]|nr:hypothetical protein [Pyrinomonadaceae bacterium]